MDRRNSTGLCKQLRRYVTHWSAGICLIVSRCAWAEFNFQTYRNRNSQNFVFLDSERVPGSGDPNPLSSTIALQYFANPVGFDQGEDGTGSFIPAIYTLNIAGEYTLAPTLSLGLDMPIHQITQREGSSIFAFGDLRLFSRHKLAALESGPSFSLVTSGYLPTGDKDRLLSNPKGGFGLNFVAESRWSRFHLAANLGADYFPQAVYRTLNYVKQGYISGGLKFDVVERWSLNSEWTTRRTAGFNSSDFYAGANHELTEAHALHLGASIAGRDVHTGALVYRALLGFRYFPQKPKVVTKYVKKTIETVKKTETIFDCGPKPHTLTLAARRLTREEKQSLKSRQTLPYRSTPQSPMALLDPGESTERDKNGKSYVRDGTVLFAVDLTGLPQHKSIRSLKEFSLVLQLRQFHSAHEESTNMLCLLNEKICSGDVYSSPARRENVNSLFFGGKEPPNDAFTKQLSAAIAKARSPKEIVTMEVPIGGLLENSTRTDPMRIIFPEEIESDAPTPKTLYFALAHDVFVRSDIRLKIEFRVEKCTQTTPQPSVVTRESETPIERGEPAHEQQQQQ